MAMRYYDFQINWHLPIFGLFWSKGSK